MFDSEGKRAFRSLLLDLMQRDGLKTYGTLWGTGIDSRMFADAGFDVTAAEVERAKHEAMWEDAERYGYEAFRGDAKRLDQRFDMFHADFCGTASPRNFEVLRAISEKVDKWLAVTLSPDHQLDPSMQGEAAIATVPAWMTYASGMKLQYIRQYIRNDGGQTMWVGLLERLPENGRLPFIKPEALQWCLDVGRDYWAASVMFNRYPDLLTHRKAPRGRKQRARDFERRASQSERYRQYSHEYYERNKDEINERMRNRRSTDPEWRAKSREYQRRYHKKRRARMTPAQRHAEQEQRRAYRHEYYQKNRDALIEKAREYRKRRKVVAP